MAAKKAPTLAEWRKQLGESTFGVLVQGMSPDDRKAAYQAFVTEYNRSGDLVEASANAVGGVQAQRAQATAAAQKAQTAPSTVPGSPPVSAAPGDTTPTSAPSAADVASAQAQNPALSDLTKGQFSAASSTTSLFGGSGLDLTTPIPGRVPGRVDSTGETLSGRGSFGTSGSSLSGRGSFGPTDPAAGSYQMTQTQTADKWLTGLYKMDPKDLRDLQTKLYGAGWYDPNAVPNPSVIPYGRVDDATIQAYEQVMLQTARYNAAGKHLTIDDVLGQGAPRVPGAGGPKKPSQQFVNPADLKAQLQQSAQTLLGENASADQAQGFSQYYQSLEQAAYAQYAQAGQDRAAGLGGSYTGPESPQNAAEDYLKLKDPQGVMAMGMASRSQEFLRLLGSATGL